MAVAAARLMNRPLDPDRSTVHGEFSHAELGGLPAPVVRYFGRVLHEGQPVIRGLTLTQDGTFFVPNGGGKWCPMHAKQQFVVTPAGFVWDAKIRMIPIIPVLVRDSYVDGVGTMHASVAGVYTLTHETATPQINSGALQRYLAEAVWFPTALLPSAGVIWRAVDEHSATATLTDRQTSVSMTFHFDETGDVVRITGDRYHGDKGGYTLRPWIITCAEHEAQNGVRVPTSCEVAWQMPDKLMPYWRGRISHLQYEFSH